MTTLATRRDALIIGLVGALFGALVAVVLVSSTPADAANGDNAVMGTKNNSRNSTQFISRNSTQFRNTKAGRPAITLDVTMGAPPMAVNSTVKVTNLNADNVDGFTSSQLRSPHGWDSSDNIQNNVEWSPVIKSIDVPAGGGTLLMTGTVDIWNSSATLDKWVSCYFIVDSSVLDASNMTVNLSPQERGNCVSAGAVTLPAGTHTVQFYTNPMADTDVQPDNGTWWVIVAPGQAAP